MLLRSNRFVGGVCAGAGLLLFVTAIYAVTPGVNNDPAGARVVAGIIALEAAFALVRMLTVGVKLDAHTITVRGLTTTDRLTRSEVLGLAWQPVTRRWYRRVVVVCTDGRVIPVMWAAADRNDTALVTKVGQAAAGFGATQQAVEGTLASTGRLALSWPVPLASPQPTLSPETVAPLPIADSAATKWLGWETIFVVTAFALPGVAAAVRILGRHLAGISDLDNFALPIPHRPFPSLFILLLGYLTTALVVPIALLLLARTGLPPKTLIVGTGYRKRDLAATIGLLNGIFALNIVMALILHGVLDNKSLTNTQHDTHVPAYFIVYALFLAATTAINEEVIVNGYFLTRLSQLGFSPQRAFWISMAVRTSYHAYYGVGFILTVPFGYLVTRSFQKHQRLARPILAHFLYDAIQLVIAVLAS